MRKLFLLFVVLGAVVLVALPYFVLPTVLENLVARDVQDRLGLAERPSVELNSDPRWRMLQGEFSGGRISTGETDLEGVQAKSADIYLDPFTVSWAETLRNRTLVSPEPISGRSRLEISEGEVSRLARQNADVPINGVELRGDGVTINSEASVLGLTFPVEVDGGVGVEGNELVFEPGTVRAAGATVPPDLAESLLAGTAFRYPVDGLPDGVTITDAETTGGAVLLTGNVSGIELGGGG